MRLLRKVLDIASILIAVLLWASLVSAPVIVPVSPDADAVEKRYRDSVQALDELRQERKNLVLRRQLALADEKHLTIDARSRTLRMCWGTALLHECGLQPHGVSAVRGGVISVDVKDPRAAGTVLLSNGVAICNIADGHACSGPHVGLEKEDFKAVLDFTHIGSKVIWQF